jgi:hypothetical protein
MSTPVEPIVILLLEVQHDDKLLYFERDAPKLPTGFHWHEGMLFQSSDDPDVLCHTVSAVMVRHNGECRVYFEERFHSVATEQSVLDWTEIGWKISDGSR